MAKTFVFLGKLAEPSNRPWRGKKKQTVLTVGQNKCKKTLPRNYK